MHVNKRDIDSIYKSLFNEDERETYQNSVALFNVKRKTNNENIMLVDLAKNYTIPIIIKKLHPRLKEKDYNNLCNNPGFLDKVALVCEDCYLIIVGSANVLESLKQTAKKNIREVNFFGKGGLNPEKTTRRFKVK